MRVVDIRGMLMYLLQKWFIAVIIAVVVAAVFSAVTLGTEFGTESKIPDEMRTKLDEIQQVVETHDAVMDSRVLNMNCEKFTLGRNTFRVHSTNSSRYEGLTEAAKEREFFDNVVQGCSTDLTSEDISALTNVWGQLEEDGTYSLVFDFKSDLDSDVDTVIPAIRSAFTQLVRGFDCEILDEDLRYIPSPKLGEKTFLQVAVDGYEDYIKGLEEKKTNLVNLLTKRELKYYNKFYLKQSTHIPSVTIFKTAGYCFVLGIVLGILFIFIQYLSLDRVKSELEIRSGFQLPVIAVVDRRKLDSYSGGKVCRGVYNKADYSDLQYVARVMTESIQVPICADLEKVSAFAADLSKTDNRIRLIDLAQKDSDTLAALHEYGETAMVISLFETRISEVKRELELYNMSGIKVRGVIVIA